MKKTAVSLLALAALWLGWTIAYFIVGNEYILPSFGDTVASAGRLLADGAFWRAFGNTFLRALWAFLASFALGVGFALLSAVVKGARAFLAPVVSVLRTVPTMAVILVLLVWTTPSVAPVVVSALVLFPAVYSAALSAIDGVREEYGALALAYGVGAKRQAFGMYLPLAAPPVLRQSGAIFSMGLKVTVSAEVLSSTYRSIGGMMQEAKLFVEMPELLALTLLTVILGFAAEGACALVCKYAVRWTA